MLTIFTFISILYYNEQKNVTRKGTLKSTKNPWNIDNNTKSSPNVRIITGKVESIVVAPPADIGASGPNNLSNKGAPNNTMSSRAILHNNAIVPASVPILCEINILLNE